MVPAMFSTSVLERRKSFDPEMNAPQGVGSTTGPMVPLVARPVGLFVDKENRQPENGAEVKAKDLGDWWRHQQRRTEEKERPQVTSSKWQRRCEELELETKAQAEQLSHLSDQLRKEEEHRKEQAERFLLILKGSEAAERLEGLKKLQEQMQKLQEKCSMQEEQLQNMSRRSQAELETQEVQSGEAMMVLRQELKDLRSQLVEAQAEAEVRKKCAREVQEELQRDCDDWQRRAQALEVMPRSEGCNACEMLLAEGRELSSTVAMLKEQCENLEVENQSLRSKVDSLQENLEYVSSSHAELAGHANHRQKIRHTIQLKTDRDTAREENFRLKQRIRQLEAGRSSQGIVNAVAGFAGTTPPKTPSRQRSSKSGFRQPRFSGLESQRDSKDMFKIQQLEYQLERNRNNVMHFLVLIERAVAKDGEGPSDAAKLLQTLRSRFLG